jgi:Tol biopolymer transport system component
MRRGRTLLIVTLAALAIAAGCGGEERAAAPATTAPAAVPTVGPGGATGAELSFESDRAPEGVPEIYMVRADGSGLARLAIGPLPLDSRSGTGAHSWSPDGQRVAFSSGEPFLAGDGNQDIYVANADGSGLTRLTDDPGDDFAPKWSPDGQRIAFMSTRDGNLEVYVMNADGSGQTNLTNDPANDAFGVFVFFPDPWSPDGKLIAFNRDGKGYVVSVEGTSEIRPIADVQGLFGGWAPAGTKILLFSIDTTAPLYEVYVVNADGTEPTRLISRPEVPMGFPTWSPDSQHIAFTARSEGMDAIHVMNADGSGVTLLTSGFCDGLYGTVWSSDGQRIAFARGCGFDRADVWVMNSDGSNQVRVAEAPAFFPAWVPSPPAP